jgi:hypothetical protein
VTKALGTVPTPARIRELVDPASAALRPLLETGLRSHATARHAPPPAELEDDFGGDDA